MGWPWVRINRLNYDKPPRCSVWSGSGWRGVKPRDEGLCEKGSLAASGVYLTRWWSLMFVQCHECKTWHWPYATRWFDPRWYRYPSIVWLEISSFWANLYYGMLYRRQVKKAVKMAQPSEEL